jgi:hypothetical protein
MVIAGLLRWTREYRGIVGGQPARVAA